MCLMFGVGLLVEVVCGSRARVCFSLCVLFDLLFSVVYSCVLFYCGWV